MQKGVSNNTLIVLAVVFVLVNLFNIVFFLQMPFPVGRIISSATATMSFCVHYPPMLQNVTNQSLTEREPFFLDINYTDRDGNSIEFLDNTTMFNISDTTGIISFTPNTSDIGRKSVNISVREKNATCGILLQGDKKALFDVWGVSNLSIRDDLKMCLSSICRYINRTIYFYANYSSFYNQTPLNGNNTYCQIFFNFSSHNTYFTSFVNMSFNFTSNLYQYNRTFNQTGRLTWNVYCDATSIWYKPLNITEHLNITDNRPPVLRFNLPNVTWNEDTTVQYYDLDDYFYDPNDDPLNYSTTYVMGVSIKINETTHRPTFSPLPNYCGNATVYFFASDPEGLTARSNLVHLRVICMEEPIKGYSSPLEAGGGGGGGTSKRYCIEYWDCGEYGNCLPTNLKYRTCIDLHECNTTHIKPNESTSCIYTGNCEDSIRNCHDGACELGVDCGGSCPPCPTCFDGIQNQGEMSIDCGGPCDPCKGLLPSLELPSIIGQIPSIIEKSLIIIALVILILIMILSAISFHFHRYVQPRLAAIITKVLKTIIAVKKKEEFISEEAALRISILLKLGELETRMSRGSIDKLSQELSNIMNEFFRELLHIDASITNEELSKQVEKMNIGPAMKIVIITFMKKIIDLEYGGYKIDREVLRRFIDEAKSVIIVTTDKPLVKGEVSVHENLVSRVDSLLVTAEKLVEKDVGKAASIYKKIAELYSMMSESDKIELYSRIQKLYQSIKEKIK